MQAAEYHAVQMRCWRLTMVLAYHLEVVMPQAQELRVQRTDQQSAEQMMLS